MKKHIINYELKFFFLPLASIILCISCCSFSLNNKNLIIENNKLISTYEEINTYSNERLDYNQHKPINSTKNTDKIYKKNHGNSDRILSGHDNFLSPNKINELILELKTNDQNSLSGLNKREIYKLIYQKILDNNKKIKKNMQLLQILLVITMLIIMYTAYDSQKPRKINIIESNAEREYEKNEILIRANKIIDGNLNEITHENTSYHHEISKKINAISVIYGKKILELKNIIHEIWLSENNKFVAIEEIKKILKNESNNELTPFIIEKIEKKLYLIEKREHEKEFLKKILESILSFFKIR